MIEGYALSVVLPNYNHSRLLSRAVGALLAQECPPDEILIIDDGSTDDSVSVIETIAAKVPTVRLLTNGTNRGAIPTLQRGLDVARGRYIYFAAADDWVMPHFFDKAIEVLEARSEIGLFCGESVLVDGRTNRPFAVRPATRPSHQGRYFNATETRELLKRIDNWILTGSSVFRRDRVCEAGGFDEALGSFADGIMARTVALTHGFYYNPKVVAAWAVFSDSYSRTTAVSPDRAVRALDVLPARLSGDPAFPPWYASLFERRWRFAASRLALEESPIDFFLIGTLAVRHKCDEIVLGTMRKVFNQRLAHVAILGWLWIRLRPTSLVSLVRTALAMRMKQFPRDSASGHGFAPLLPNSKEL